jgi:hypothetical protein
MFNLPQFIQQVIQGPTVGSGEAITIASVDPQTDITVDYGTLFSGISFPALVDVILSDTTVVSVDVVWDEVWDEGDYDETIDGFYTLFGTLMNLPDGVTNPLGLTGVVVVEVLPYDDSGLPNTKALFQAIGSGSSSDVGSATFVWPAHAIDDIGILSIETTPADAAPTTPSGWNLISHSSNTSGSSQARLSTFWRRAVSAAEANVVVPSPGNHITGVIFTMRGCYKNLTPVDVTAVSSQAITTALSIPGISTNQDGCDVIYIAAAGLDSNGPIYSSPANANLTSLTERYDAGTNLGGGGVIGIWSGNLATAGATGTLTATQTNSITAHTVISFKGVNNFSAPVLQATNVLFAGDRSFNFTKGGGGRTLALYNLSGAINGSFLPVNGTSYTVGQDLGGGNIVAYDGTGTFFTIPVLPTLSHGSDFAVRMFSYNTSGAGPLYNGNTATGNPLVTVTITPETWYSYKAAIAQSRRDIGNVATVSNAASKSYSGSLFVSGTERHVYCVVDNQLNTPAGSDFDKTMLRFQPVGSAPHDIASWDWYKDVSGEPIPILNTGDVESNGLSVQNWLGTVINVAGTKFGYRSVNVGNNATRYSLGKTTISADGRTATRITPYVFEQTSGKNYYQWGQPFLDTDLNEIILLVPMGGLGTEGRWPAMDVYRSTDSAAGLVFTKLASNIYHGTEIELAGFGLQGNIWKEGGRYHWYQCAGVTPDFIGQADLSNVPIYPWLNYQIVEVSCDVNFATTPIIEQILYTSDFQAEVAVFPGSVRFSHAGIDYIMMNCFRWKIEGGTTAFKQVEIDVKLLVNSVIPGTLVGQNIYPAVIHKFYKFHQSNLSDVFGSTTVLPVEHLSGTALTVVDAPTQISCNRVNFTNGYITDNTLTAYNQQHFGLKIAADDFIITGGQDRALCEKAGVFKLWLEGGSKLCATVFGSNGNSKTVKSVQNILDYRTDLRDTCDFGFIANINAGGTDINIQLLEDYTIITDVTTSNTGAFTLIATNANIVQFGRASATSPYTRGMRTCLIFSASTDITRDDLVNEAIS